MARSARSFSKDASLLRLLLIFWAVFSGAFAGCASPASMSALSAQHAAPKLLIPTAITPQMPRDDYVPGVQNFGFISADVWRGALPTPAGLRSLADLGVRTIIDLREDDESAAVPPGVHYVRMPVSRWHADRVDTQAVLAAISTSPKPVFIHCVEGRDRTGLAIAAYRLSQGMSPEDALQEMRNFHVNIWWRELMRRRIRELANSMSKPSAVSHVTEKRGASAANEDIISVR